MDSFTDNTEVIKIGRNFRRALEMDSFVYNTSITRHNLEPDFEETPAKSMRLTMTDSMSGSMKRSFSSLTTPTDHESSLLKKQLTLRDAEIISLKASITQLENRISSVEVAARHAQIEHDKELAKLKGEKDRESLRSSEMRSKLQYVMEKEKNAREEVQKLEESLQRRKQEMDKKLQATHREKLETADHAHQVEVTWLETESKLRKEIMLKEIQIADIQSKYEESQAQLDLRKRRQVESNEQEREIQALKAQLKEEQQKNKDLTHRLSEHEDNLVATKALKSDLDMVPSMKSELEKLRMDNEHLRRNEQNTLLLEEEVRSLKKKLEYSEASQKRVAELEVENEELHGRLHRWEAADASGSRRPQSPSSLTRRIQELETSQASLTLKQGEMQTNVNSTRRKLEQAQTENLKLKAELSASQNTESQLNDMIKRLQRKLLLVSKERDSYRGLLDSYESEVTVNFDAEKRAQMQQLEGILQGYKEQASEAEAEISRLTNKLADTQTKYDQVQQQLQTIMSSGMEASNRDKEDTIRQLREKVAELENKFWKTEEEKNILEARIEQKQLQGDYDPSKTKIVHFLNNPCAIAEKRREEEVDRLKEENETLRKRNQILEEHGGQVEDLTVQVQEKLQHPSPSKELEDVKSQLNREEMRNKRLMEVFKKTSKEFRETCYQLTGYRIDIPCSNQYRLTSMYAESSKDYLLFQKNDEGEIQLLRTDFSMSLQDAMETYLQRQNSIPLFLSHITMDLFSRQTMTIR